jgi:hypothetical protein
VDTIELLFSDRVKKVEAVSSRDGAPDSLRLARSAESLTIAGSTGVLLRAEIE